MSQTIDSRVVEMTFDNSQFQKNVQATLDSLDKLDKSVNNLGKGTSLDGVSNAIGKTKAPVDDVTQSVGKLQKAFSMPWGVAAQRVVMNLTDSFYGLGKSILSNVSQFTAMRQGFGEYELKMGSVQTIMSSTGEKIGTVNKYLEELNRYSDRTIYSFSDMTNNIGKFTNAGVKLKDAVKAIQGISNEAALSGANANEASRAMYNFSQALSAGYVKLIDWKSIENANMATKNFKQELINTAVQLGTLEKVGKNAYKTLSTNAAGKTMEDIMNSTKNFNDSLQYQWMTSNVLTKTLAKYSDETTELGKKAFAAAQDIKTFSQWMDTLKEALGSQWAQTFEILFGNLEQAKKLWTNLNNVVSPILERRGNRRNAMLKYWAEFGGRDAILDTFKNLYRAIQSVVKPIQSAFKAIFPSDLNKRGKLLVTVSKNLERLSKKLILSGEKSQQLQKWFEKLFTTLQRFMKMVRQTAENIDPLVKKLQSLADKYMPKIVNAVMIGIGMILYFADSVSKWVMSHEVVRKTVAKVSTFVINALNKVEKTIDGVIDGSIDLAKIVAKVGKISADAFGDIYNFVKSISKGGLGKVAEEFRKFFKTIATSYLPTVLGAIALAFKELAKFLVNTGIPVALNAIRIALQGLWYIFRDNVLIPGLEKLGELLGKLGKIITGSSNNALKQLGDILGKTLPNDIKRSGISFDKFGKKVNKATTNPVYNFVELVKGKFNAFLKAIVEFSKKAINALKAINDFFKGDQAKWTIDRVFDLGESAILLNMLYELKVALKSFNAIFTGTAGTITAFNGILTATQKTILGFGGVLKSQSHLLNAKAILSIAIAIGILTASLIALSYVPFDQLKHGAIALTGLASGMAVFTKIIGTLDPKTFVPVVAAFSALMIAVGVAAFGCAAAMAALTLSIVAFRKIIEYYATLDPKVFEKGLGKIREVVGVLATYLSSLGMGLMFGKNAGIALLAMAASLIILEKAINKFASIKADVFKSGLERIGKAIGVFTGFIRTLTLPAMASSLGLDMMGIALNILAITVALKVMVGSIEKISAISSKKVDGAIDQIKKLLRSILVFVSVIALLTSDLGFSGRKLGLAKGKTGMLGVASTLMSLALVIQVLVGAVEKLAGIDPKSLDRGVDAFRNLIIIIGAFTAGVSLLADPKTLASMGTVAGVIVAIAAAVTILGKLPTDVVAKGVASISVSLIALGASLKLAGKGVEVKDALKLVSITLVIGVLAASLILLAGHPWYQILAATVALNATIVALALAVKSMNIVNGADVGKFAAVVAGIAFVAASLYFLAQNDWKRLAAAGLGLAGTVAAMGVVIKAMGMVTDLKSLLVFGTVIAGLFAIGYALTMLASQPFNSMVGAAISMGSVVVAVGACIALMSLGNAEKQAASFLMVTMSLCAIGFVLCQLAKFGWKDLLAATTAMIGTVAGVVIAVKVFEGIQLAPAAMAIAKAGVLVAEIVAIAGGIVAEIMVLGAALGQLAKTKFIHDGLTSLASIIGEIQGAFTASKAAAGTEKLPEVGKRISEFTMSIAPFFALLRKTPIDDINKFVDAMSKIGNIRVKKGFFSKKTELQKFGDNLAYLGTSLLQFSFATRLINTDKINAAASVLTRLASLKVDGGTLTKKGSLETLVSNLKPLGKGLSDFSEQTKDIDMIPITNSINALSRIGSVKMGKNFATNLVALANNLASLGSGFKAFGEEMRGAHMPKVMLGIKILERISAIKKLPNLSGVKQLKKQIKTLGEVIAIMDHNVNFTEADMAGIKSSIKLINKLSTIKPVGKIGTTKNLKARINNIGEAITALRTGKGFKGVTTKELEPSIKLISALSGLSGKKIPSFKNADLFRDNSEILGKGVESFVAAFEGHNKDELSNGITIIKTLGTLKGSYIPSFKNADSFSEGIVGIKKGVGVLATEFSGNGISNENIDKSISIIKKLNGFKDIHIPKFKSAASFKSGVDSIVEGVKSLVNGFTGEQGTSITAESLDMPIKALERLSKLKAVKIPKLSNAEEFKTNAPGLGEALASFINGFKTIPFEDFSSLFMTRFFGNGSEVSDPLDRIKGLLVKLSEIGKIKIPKFKAVESFSTNAPELASATSDFVNGFVDKDGKKLLPHDLFNIQTILTYLSTIGELKIPKMNDAEAFKTNSRGFAESIVTFVNGFGFGKKGESAVTFDKLSTIYTIMRQLELLGGVEIPEMPSAQTFVTNSKGFGQAISDFVNSFKDVNALKGSKDLGNGAFGITPKDIQAIKELMTSMSELGSIDIPTFENAEAFRTNSAGFGKAVVDFVKGFTGSEGVGNKLKGLIGGKGGFGVSEKEIDTIISIFRKLSELSSIVIPTLPNSLDFQVNSAGLAKAVVKFTTDFSGIVEGDISTVVSAMGTLSKLSTIPIPKLENAQEFKTNSAGFGTAVINFIDSFKGKDGIWNKISSLWKGTDFAVSEDDLKQIDKVMTALNKLGQFNVSIPTLSGTKTFVTNLGSLRRSISTFNNVVGKIKVTALVNKVKQFQGLNNLKLNDSAISNYTSSLRSMATGGIAAFSSTITNAKGLGKVGASLSKGVIGGIDLKAFSTAGNTAGANFVTGIRSYNYHGAYDAGLSLGSTIIRGVKDKLGISSPSKIMFKLGNWTTSGYLNGLASQYEKLKKEAKKLAETPAKETEKANEISSPSKVMYRLGKFTVQGFIKGIKESKASKWITNYVNSTLKQVFKSMKGFQAMSKSLGISIREGTVKSWVAIYKASDKFKSDKKTLENASKKLAKAYDSLGKTIKKVGKISGGKSVSKWFGKGFTKVLRKAPEKAFARATKGITKMLKSFRKKIGGKNFTKLFGKNFLKKFAKEPKKYLSDLEKGLEKRLKKLSKKVQKNKTVKNYVKSLKQVIKALKQVNNGQLSAKKAGQAVWKGMADAVKEWTKSVEDAYKNFTSMSNLALPMDVDFTGKNNVANERLDAIEGLKEDWKDANKELAEATERYNRAKELFDETAEKDENAWDYSIGRSAELKADLEDAEEELKNAQETFDSINKQMNDLGAFNVRIDVDDESKVLFDENTKAYWANTKKEWKDNVKAQIKSYNDYYSELRKMTKKFTKLIKNGAIDGSKDMAVMAESFRDYLVGLGYSEVDTIRMINSMTDSELKDAIKIYKGYEKTQAEEMLNSYKERIKDATEFYANLQLLAKKGLSSDVYMELLNMGPESASGIVASLVAAGQTGITEINKLYSARMAAAKKAGKIAGEGYAETFVKEVNNAVKKANEATKKTTTKKTTTKKTTSKNAGAGGGKKSTTTKKTTKKTSKVKLKSVLSTVKQETKQIGSSLVDGLNLGALSKLQSLKDTASSVASTAVNTVKTELQVNSPSKVFAELGKFMMLGLAAGINDNTAEVVTAEQIMAKAISEIPALLQSDMDASPVITPVIDLSQAKIDAGKVGELFGDKTVGLAVDVSRSVNPKVERNQNGSTTNTYDNSKLTQTNNFYIRSSDPKAVANEVEIILQKKANRRIAAWE